MNTIITADEARTLVDKFRSFENIRTLATICEKIRQHANDGLIIMVTTIKFISSETTDYVVNALTELGYEIKINNKEPDTVIFTVMW